MGISLTQQTASFLTACLIGIALGVFYDIFRVSRIALRTSRAVLFIEDLTFFLVCTWVTFGFMLRSNMGEVRWFIIFGEFLGAAFYYFTVGEVVMKMAEAIIKTVRKILHRINMMIIRPIARLICRIIRFILLPVRVFKKIIKKITIKSKISLKRQSVLLYNLYNVKKDAGGSKKKLTANALKESRTNEPEEKRTDGIFI